MAANTEYTKIKESTISSFFSKLKAAFWPKNDVVNVNLANVAVTGDYNDLSNKPTTTPEIFWATYGVTTFNEIDEAVAANKIVMLKYTDEDTDRILRLQSCSKFSGYGFATFTESGENKNVSVMLAKGLSGENWQEIREFEQELQTSKTKYVYIPLDEDEGYRMYPSLLAVYNFIREHLSQIEGVVFAPTIIPLDGLEDNSAGRILIQCVTPNVNIYYRFNQTGDFTLYNGNYIYINESTVVEAYAELNGVLSKTITKLFEIYN